MAKTLIFRNGPTTSLASVIGAQAELFVDTTLNTVVVMDGVTSGGTTLARNADVQTLSSVTTSSIAYLSSVAATKATSSIFGIIRVDGTSLVTVATGVVAIAVSSNGYGVRTVSASAPSGGADGDVWYQV
jgi:hypothetical protein